MWAASEGGQVSVGTAMFPPSLPVPGPCPPAGFPWSVAPTGLPGPRREPRPSTKGLRPSQPSAPRSAVPPFLLPVHNGICAFTRDQLHSCPSPVSRLLPFPLHPSPVSSVARGQYGCQGHKTTHLGGWVGLVPGDIDSQCSHRVGSNWVWILPRPIHQPGHWDLSPAWGCQPPQHPQLL